MNVHNDFREYASLYYFSYPAIILVLIAAVAWMLHRAGRVLVDASPAPEGELWTARMIHLLIAGVCLVGFGYLVLTIDTRMPVNNIGQVVEMESVKIGIGGMLLGAVYLFNVFLLATMRRRSAGLHVSEPQRPASA